MKHFIYLLPCIFLLSCGSNPPVATIQDVKPVDVKPARESVVIVTRYTNEARTEIALAKREAEEARIDAEFAKGLVEAMKEAESPYTVQVAELRKSYETRLKKLSEHITETDRILTKQAAELLKTDDELSKAANDAAVANQANELLITSNKTLAKQAAEGAKYKTYWDSRWERQIKTIAWSVGITLAVIIGLITWQFLLPSGMAASIGSRLLNNRR